MKFKFQHIAFAIAMALSLSAAKAAPPDDSVDQLVEKGKTFERKLQATEALPCYLAAAKMEPENPRILVRIARQYRYLMTDAAAKEEKLRLGWIALDYS